MKYNFESLKIIGQDERMGHLIIDGAPTLWKSSKIMNGAVFYGKVLEKQDSPIGEDMRGIAIFVERSHLWPDTWEINKTNFHITRYKPEAAKQFGMKYSLYVASSSWGLFGKIPTKQAAIAIAQNILIQLPKGTKV